MSERTTLYLPDRDEFHDHIRRLQLEHDEAKRAEKHEIHEAIVEVAFNNVDELVEYLAG